MTVIRRRPPLPGLPPTRNPELGPFVVQPPASLHAALSGMQAARARFDVRDLSALALIHLEQRGMDRDRVKEAVLVWTDDPESGTPVLHLHWPEAEA